MAAPRRGRNAGLFVSTSGGRNDGDATSVLALKRPPTHPGEVLLEEFLKPAEMTQVEAARRMGIPLNRLNEVIRGRRGVSADTALRLAKLLDTSAEILQVGGRLAIARRDLLR